MMLIDLDRSDNPLGQLMVILLEVQDQLLHRAAGACARSKDQDFLGAVQGSGDGLVKAFLFRLALAVGVVLLVMQLSAKTLRIIWRNPMRNLSVQLRAENSRASR